MGKTSHKRKRVNTYFRQTASSLRAARQTQIFAKLKRNIPYNLYSLSKKRFSKKVTQINSNIGKHTKKFARKLKRDKFNK